jgi:predicted RNase H-like HicB family nuclease
MRRSIAQYGYYGIQFIDKAVTETIAQITEKLGDAAKEYIERLYDEGRIFPRFDSNRP